MKRILAILRTSTERQEILSQRNEMMSFICSLGYSENEIEWIEVQGASARKLNEKYIKMINSIKETIELNKDIKACALWHLNRLGRVDSVLIEMKNWFISKHIQLYVKNPTITLLNDDGTVNGGAEIAFGLFATMVKQETDEMFQKFHRGKKRNALNMKFNGGNKEEVLFGYMVDNEGYIVPNPKEVEIVKLIFDLYSSGKHSIYKVADELEQRGIEYRGRRITHSVVSRCIKNESYIGLNNERKYIPLIDKELWNKVKSIREANRVSAISKETKNIHFAIKILKCKKCGRNYLADGSLYHCVTRRKYRTFNEKCDGVCGSIKVIDTCLFHYAKALEIAHNALKQVEVNNSLQERRKTLRTKLRASESKLKAMKGKYERLEEEYILNGMKKDRYSKLKLKLDEEKKKLTSMSELWNNELISIENRIKSMKGDTYGERLINSTSAIMNEELTLERKNELVHEYIKEAFIQRVGMYIELHIYAKNCINIQKYRYKSHTRIVEVWRENCENWVQIKTLSFD